MGTQSDSPPPSSVGAPLDALDEDCCKVVLLLRAVGKDQDRIVKAFDDLIRRQMPGGAHGIFQPPLTEFFPRWVFKFHKTVSDEQENVVSFESDFRGRLGNEVWKDAQGHALRIDIAVRVVSNPRSGGIGTAPGLLGLTVMSELPQRNLGPRNHFHQVRRRNSPKTSWPACLRGNFCESPEPSPNKS